MLFYKHSMFTLKINPSFLTQFFFPKHLCYIHEAAHSMMKNPVIFLDSVASE